MSEVPVPRPAATVVLLRPTGGSPTADGFEVFVLRRVASMAFAPSMTVFPGGGVDPVDAEPAPWYGPAPAWFARRFGLSDAGDHELARRIVTAAVRELCEETGVLLAVPADAPLISPCPAEPIAPQEPSSRLGVRLAREHLATDAARLRPWAHWVTPPGRSRRYDTWFFVADLPVGADPSLTTTEADQGFWATPEQLLAADGAGSVRLMPPTRAVLTDLARHATVAGVLAAEPDIVPWTRSAAGEIVRHRPATGTGVAR